jgi:hypothetical protein
MQATENRQVKQEFRVQGGSGETDTGAVQSSVQKGLKCQTKLFVPYPEDIGIMGGF